MSAPLPSTVLDDLGWLAIVVIHILILVLLTWTLIIRRMRLSADQRRQAVATVWRPILSESLIEPPASLPAIHPRDHILFLYLWNHLQESIKGEPSNELCKIIYRTKMDAVVHQYLATGTMRQQLLALVTLGHMKEATVWPRLVDLAHADNAFLSIEAARALMRIDAPGAIPVLVPLIARRDDWSLLKVLAILQSVQGYGEHLVAQALGEAAQQATPMIAARLIRFLAFIRNYRALPFIRPLLDRQPLHEDILASCLSMFGQCGDPHDLPVVRRHLTHPTWFIRVQAATALGKMGVEEDETLLIKLLEDTHWWVRYRGAEALSILPTMTDEKLTLLVQTLPPGEGRHILTPFVAKRIEASLAAAPETPGLSTAA
ncbi:MAG: HEAT repeat domain-containing protein [Nitrospira sp.]|nr:HEAT repeat domain-containing protein [Nitrospira sp.]